MIPIRTASSSRICQSGTLEHQCQSARPSRSSTHASAGNTHTAGSRQASNERVAPHADQAIACKALGSFSLQTMQTSFWSALIRPFGPALYERSFLRQGLPTAVGWTDRTCLLSLPLTSTLQRLLSCSAQLASLCQNLNQRDGLAQLNKATAPKVQAKQVNAAGNEELSSTLAQVKWCMRQY